MATNNRRPGTERPNTVSRAAHRARGVAADAATAATGVLGYNSGSTNFKVLQESTSVIKRAASDLADKQFEEAGNSRSRQNARDAVQFSKIESANAVATVFNAMARKDIFLGNGSDTLHYNDIMKERENYIKYRIDRSGVTDEAQINKIREGVLEKSQNYDFAPGKLRDDFSNLGNNLNEMLGPEAAGMTFNETESFRDSINSELLNARERMHDLNNQNISLKDELVQLNKNGGDIQKINSIKTSIYNNRIEMRNVRPYIDKLAFKLGVADDKLKQMRSKERHPAFNTNNGGRAAAARIITRPATEDETIQTYSRMNQYRQTAQMVLQYSVKAAFLPASAVGKTVNIAGSAIGLAGAVVKNPELINAGRTLTEKSAAFSKGVSRISNELAHPNRTVGKRIWNNLTRPMRTAASNASIVIGSKVRTTHIIIHKQFSAWAKKAIIDRMMKTKFGNAISATGSFLKQTVGSALKVIGRAIGGFVNLVLTVVGAIISAIMMIINLAIAIVIIILLLTMIMDAVSNTYEDFCAKTTMGATYKKLVEKEKEFNAATADLINQPIPAGYDSYYIKTQTNFNVHWIGADGLEMFSSSGYAESAGVTGVGGAEVIYNDVSDRIWEYLKECGQNDYAIAGIMGNIMNECSMNPADGHDTPKRHDIGIVQWTAGRFTAFKNQAASNGYDPVDVECQLKYLMVEPGYQKYIAGFGKRSWTNAADAAQNFASQYEMYQNYQTDTKEKMERINAAQTYFEHYSTDPDFANIQPDEDVINSATESGGTGSSGSTSTTGTITNGSSSSFNGVTIKGILSMAAIYINQDFSKYGSPNPTDFFGDSVYKDYCAKLYDSTHIIGKDTTPPTVYYCPALNADAPDSEYHVALDSCNNFIPGGSTESTDESLNRVTSCTYSIDKSAYYMAQEIVGYSHDTLPDGSTDSSPDYADVKHPYQKYSFNATGPHGTHSGTVDKDYSGYTREDIIAEFTAETGCTHPVCYVTEEDEGSTTYTVACGCPQCRGHIDGNAYVFVSNIYDPSGSTSSTTASETAATADPNSTDETESTSDETESASTGSSNDAYNNVEKKSVESRFSMYALDKYATAFSGGESSGDTSTGEEAAVGASGAAGPGETQASETESSADSSNSASTETDPDKHAGEQYVMETLTGKPIEIVDWQQNTGWWNNPTPTRTHYYIYDGTTSFESLDQNQNGNVINSSNGKEFTFNAFTRAIDRNTDFEKVGQTSDNITLVRMLMAGDQTSLYGIKDFGGITGTPLTSAQIAQLIANSPDQKNLCTDRKAIMATSQQFENLAIQFNTKYVYGGGHSGLKFLNEITAADVFDCSSYVCTILKNSGLYLGGDLSTAGIYDSPYFEKIGMADLKAGDLLVAPNHHVVMYMGGSNIAQAAHTGTLLKNTQNTPDLTSYMSGYTAMRLKSIREDQYDSGSDADSTDSNTETESK